MHNLTPHVHGDHAVPKVFAIDAEAEGGDLLDWMQRLFAQDLGEGHLEHCVAADGNHMDIDWDFHIPSLMFPFEELHNASVLPAEIKTKPPLIAIPISRISFIHLPLRAPPVFA